MDLPSVPVLSVVLAAAGVACGGGVLAGDGADAGGDVTNGDGNGDAPAESGLPGCARDGRCNDLENCGPRIRLHDVPAEPPTPTGGSIAEGVYVLTDYTIFTGDGGIAKSEPLWMRQTIEVRYGGPVGDAAPSGDAGAARVQLIVETDSMDAVSNNGVMSAEPPVSLQLDLDCRPDSWRSPYSAQDGKWIMFLQNPAGIAGTGLITYEKQP